MSVVGKSFNGSLYVISDDPTDNDSSHIASIAAVNTVDNSRKQDKEEILNKLDIIGFNTRLVITESNAAWTPPVTGWARVTVIGGGGAGMSVAGSYYTGGSGGDSSFGSLTAKGGRAGMSGSSKDATIPDAGGYAGEVVMGYIYISEDTPISIVIGAGGIAGKTNSTAGYVEYPGTAHTWATSGPGTTYYGSGGNGGSNGTKYGGGGGSAGVGHLSNPNAMKGGVGAGGGKNGSGYSGTPNSTLVKGGNGGHGAVIIEYYDPAKEIV